MRFKAIKREVDTAKHRAVCGTSCVLLKYGMPIPSRVSDFCSSTIFGGYFLCKKCGRDFCLQCERYFSESLETIRDSPWDIPDAARPRLLRCTGGVERIQGKIGSKVATQFHVRPDLQPVSRFDAKELKQQWVALAEFVLRGIESLEQQLQQLGVAEDEAELKKLVEEWMAQRMAQAALERQTQPAVSEEDIAALYQKRTNPAITPISDPAGLEDLSLPFLLIPADRLNNETFDTLWARGEPIIVDGVGQRMKYPWTPDTFIERFGAELCGWYLSFRITIPDRPLSHCGLSDECFRTDQHRSILRDVEES